MKMVNSRAPKSIRSDFGAFGNDSVVESFGFQMMTEIRTKSFGFRTFGWSTSQAFGLFGSLSKIVLYIIFFHDPI